MSTERQDYSLEFQAATNVAYALEHGHEIVRTYTDAGISGLTIERRDGLKALISDVVNGSADYSVVLVYDVSRWGRFQNPDQSAHYEFICSEMGVRVEYCAEPFDNDGSPTSALLKHVKRAMAAEYSRDLSAKVSTAHWRLAAAGFWQGGSPGYGLRRAMVRRGLETKRVMEAREFKGAQNGRTILVPGPASEVAVVRRIYRMSNRDRLSDRAIARTLNAEGILHAPGRRWSPYLVADVLTNEKYIGVNLMKHHRRMGARQITVPEGQWVRCADAFEPLITKRDFELARRLRSWRRNLSEDELLDALRSLFRRRGKVSRKLIDSDPDLPSARIYDQRFGSLVAAYARAGLKLDWRQSPESMLAKKRHRFAHPKGHRFCRLELEQVLAELRQVHIERGMLSRATIDGMCGVGASKAAAARLGGSRRMYALAGYAPNDHQRAVLRQSACQVLSEHDAEALRLAVLAGVSPPLEWRLAIS